MYGRYSSERYISVESQVDRLKDELDDLMKEYWDYEEEHGEEEAEAMFREDIDDLESQIEDYEGELAATETHWLEQEYWASVL